MAFVYNSCSIFCLLFGPIWELYSSNVILINMLGIGILLYINTHYALKMNFIKKKQLNLDTEDMLI
jgi:hypothetical protein